MMFPPPHPRRLSSRLPELALPASLLLMLLVTGGCRRAEIRTYLAPKDVETPAATAHSADDGHDHGAPPPAQAAAPPSGPSAAAAAAQAPNLSYTPAAEWTKIPGDRMNAVRFVFTSPQGEVSINITALGSMQGREPMLVGMWRSVLGLPELSAEDAAKALSPVEIAGEQGQMFEVTGNADGKPMRILTAFLHRGPQSWFFKMQGPPEGVESQKAAFTAFLKTVKF